MMFPNCRLSTFAVFILIKFTNAEIPRIIPDIDLLTLEKYGGWVPTGLTAFGAVMAIAIKKIIILAVIIFGTALALKFFSGFWHHRCPHHKPIFYKEIEYEKPYYDHKFEEYGRKFDKMKS